jgi:UDP-N-acetylmuramyl pentapeptide phosphotransferase/UDP-N-acetylglucosamine-1-phosphate transferase
MIKIKKIARVLIPLLCFILLYFFSPENTYKIVDDQIIRLPFIQVYFNYILVAILLILYAFLYIWADNFKMSWKNKSYIPALIIIGSCIMIVVLWHIDKNIRICFN